MLADNLEEKFEAAEAKPIEEVKEAEVVEAVEAETTETTEETMEGPTNAQIDRWKKEHGRIYKNIIDGEVYIWRRLRRREYVDAIAIKTDSPSHDIYVRQNIIAAAVTLYPEAEVMAERIEMYAGLATEVADRAVYKSGFEVSETVEL